MFAGKRRKPWQIIMVVFLMLSMILSYAIPGMAVDDMQIPEWASEAAIQVNDVNESSFNFSWPAATGAENYKLVVSNITGEVVDNVLNTVVNDGNTCSVNGLMANNQYNVKVTAANIMGDSANSLETVVITVAESTEPAPVDTQDSDETADNSTDDTRDDPSTLESKEETTPDNNPTVMDNIMPLSQDLIIHEMAEELQVPSWEYDAGITVSNVTGSSFDLNWTAATGADSYQVAVSNTAPELEESVYVLKTTNILDTTVLDTSITVNTGLVANRHYDIKVTASNSAGDSPGSLTNLVVTTPDKPLFNLASGTPDGSVGRYVFQPAAAMVDTTDFEEIWAYDNAIDPTNTRFLWYLQAGFNNTNARVHVNSFRLFNLTDGEEIALNYGNTDFGTGTAGWTASGITESDTGYTLSSLMTSGDFEVAKLTPPGYSVCIRFELDVAKYLEANKEYAITIDPQFNTGGNNPTVLGKVYSFEFRTAQLPVPSWESSAALTVSELVNTSFNLSWPEADGAEEYKVLVSTTCGGETTDVFNTTIDELSCTVNNLIAGHRYDIKVIAANSSGNSPASLETMLVTPSDSVLPELASLPLNDSNSRYKFQPNATKEAGRSTEYETVFVYDEAVKIGLTQFEWYMQNGFNGALSSIKEDIRSFRLFNMTDGNEIALDYGQLDSDDADYAFAGLDVNPNKWARPTTVTTGDFTVEKVSAYSVHFIFQPNITDYLEPDKEYAITIDPHFQIGGQYPSVLGKLYRFEFSTGSADTQAPVWPDNPQISIGEIKADSIALSWSEANDDTVVSRYRITVSDNQGIVGSFETVGSITSYLVTGLSSNTEYSFTVTALDFARNESISIDAVSAKTLPGIPVWSENAILTAESVMATELVLRWPQVSNTSDLDGYKVYVDGIEEASLPAIQTYYDLYGLNSGKKYILSVKPFNEIGELGEAIETMVVTPGGGGLTFAFLSAAVDEGEDGYYHNYQIANPVDMDDFSLAWNFSNGLDKNLRFNLECIRLIEKSTGQEISLDLGIEPYESTLEGVFAAGDFKYISTGGGDGTGDGDSGLDKVRMLKFEPGDLTLDQMAKGAQYIIEIDPEFTANNGTATLGKIFTFSFITAVDDTQAPAWPAGPQLTASNVGTDALVLSWPEASDNIGITEYQLFELGTTMELIQAFGSQITAHKIEDLIPNTTHTFILRAKDAKSNYTSNLILSVTTLLTDEQAPNWPAGSKLRADHILTDNLDLSWTVAEDNVEVTGYRLLMNGNILADLDTGIFAYHVGQLSPATTYIFAVEARDKAGNYSTNGPRFIISTLEGEADTTPPYWTNNGSYSTSTVYGYDKTYPTYKWPWAADNVAVTGYLVFRNGVQIATLDAYTNSYTDTLDLDNSSYSYSVFAVDAAGNKSVEGNQMSVYSGNPDQDVYSPTWPADKSITLSEFTDNSILKVKWTPAQDNVAVRGYVIIKDGIWIEWADRGAADTETRSFNDCFVQYNPYINYGGQPGKAYPALISGQTYTFSVKAFDTTENSSKGDPSITFVMGTNPTAGAGIPFVLTNIENTRGSLNSITGAVNQVTAPLDPENTIFSWEFDELLATGYDGKISLINADTSDPIPLESANFQYSENEGKGLLTLDLTQTGLKLADNNQYVVKLDRTLAAQGGHQLGFDIAWQFSTDVADKEVPYWDAGDALAVDFIKAPTIAALSWPDANDGVAVTCYQVYQGDELLATLPDDQLAYDIEGLNVNTEYTFKVVAGDYLQNLSDPLTITVTTPAADNTAPNWQQGDVLEFNDIGSDNITVSWPAAADNYMVKEYQLYLDGGSEPIGVTAGDVLVYAVTGLAGETTYNIMIKAVDFSGNAAELTDNVTTIADVTKPLWPEGSRLQARDIKDTSVTLYWDAATDNVGVTQYNIYRNGELVQSVDGLVTELTIDGLNGSTEYTFTIEAQDLKENKTDKMLSLVQWTAPGSIAAGANIAFNLEKPLSYNLSCDSENNTLNNKIEGSFTKNNVSFIFSFGKPLAPDTWQNNVELKTSGGTAIQLDASTFTYMAAGDKLKIIVPADLVINGQYVLTLKETLQAADGTLLGRNFAWAFNVSVGPYGVTDIAAGYNSYSPFLPPSSRYYLMLKDDGSVWTWGNNDYGTLGDSTTDSRDIPTRVEALTGIIALEAGRDSCFALDQDGAIWAWGSNEYGQLGKGIVPSGTSGRYDNTVPERIDGLPQIEKLSYGFGNVVALDVNGEVWNWGRSSQEGLSSTAQCSGTPLRVNGLTGVIDVAAGYNLGMAVTSMGDVYSFASGNAPAKANNLSEIIAVDAEGIDQRNTVRMALKTDGTAYIWDANSSAPVTNIPTRVENATQVKAVIADGPYVLGTDGQVTSVAYSAEPVLGAQISGLNNVVKLASSANGGLALQADGTLLQFIGTEVSEVSLNLDTVDVPVWPEASIIEITNLAETGLTLNWQKPETNVSSFAIYQDGNRIATVSGETQSYNILGLTKDQTYTFKLEARLINSGWSTNGPEIVQIMNEWNPAMQGAGKVAVSAKHALMVGDDGSVWVWGQNEFGQLGIGNNTEQLTPVKIDSLDKIVAVAAGYNHSLALDQDGNVWAWGKNDLYQLGNNGTDNSNIPIKVISGNIKDISAAANYSLALKNDSTVLGWGEACNANCYFALEGGSAHQPVQMNYNNNNPSDVHPFIGVKDIAAGGTFIAYLFSDGRICRQGSFVDEKGAGTYSPMRHYSTALGVAAVTAGENFVIALKEDGTVLTMGDNNLGQYGDGTQGNGTPADPRPYGVVTGLNNIVAVAAGGYHGLALDQDGTVYTWGKNLYGQLGTGKTNIHLSPVKVAGLTEITAIGGGTESSMAFRNVQKVYVWGNNDNGQLGNNSKVDSKVPTLVEMPGYEGDIDAPVWPAYFAIVATDITYNSIKLMWSPANDDIGVTAYEIYVNGSMTTEVDGNMLEYTIEGLYQGFDYTLSIKAKDAAGNTSEISRQISVATEGSSLLTPPGLNADITDNKIGEQVALGFAVNETWIAAITELSVDGEVLEDTKYTITSESININAEVFTCAKDYSIVIKATGYYDAMVNQPIIPALISPVYNISPTVDDAYTNGETEYGIKTMTVKTGVSGFKYFEVSITPVNEHDGDEVVVFVHMRNGIQKAIAAAKADYDTVKSAKAGFNVQAGDIVKAYIVDDLTNEITRNPIIYQ